MEAKHVLFEFFVSKLCVFRLVATTFRANIFLQEDEQSQDPSNDQQKLFSSKTHLHNNVVEIMNESSSM